MIYTQQEYFEVNIRGQIIRFPKDMVEASWEFVKEEEKYKEKIDLSLPKELFKI